jgi:replicative DNA helicase Mcm
MADTYLSSFEDFFNERYRQDLEKMSEFYPGKRSLEVDFKKLDAFDSSLADELIKKPYALLRSAKDAILQLNVVALDGGALKPHVRFFNIPKEHRVDIRDINSSLINTFISVEGIITKITDVKPRIIEAVFQCRHCGRIYTVAQSDLTGKLSEPGVCACERKNFELLQEQSKFIDTQKAEIQEPLEVLRGGEQAKKTAVWLLDDLTNKLIPGDKVEVAGVLQLQNPKYKGSIYDTFIDANHVNKLEKEFEELELNKEDMKKIHDLSKDPHLFDKIVGSIAPSIYGHSEIKEAIALQLFGGTPNKVKPDGMKIRSDTHILLIGDPGTSKTQLLRYVKELAPKGIYVSGKSTTGAGLTATAEKEEWAEGGWTLKAGALVIAAGGIAAVDEFDKMEDEDRSAMHEAMESQQISVAKAGMLATFKANTAILAAANPKYGRFDINELPAEQFDIPPTLLSRFDLIFPVKDVLDPKKDMEVADHILAAQYSAGMRAIKQDKEGLAEIEKRVLPVVETDLLRKYIAFARKEFKPVLTEESMEKMKSFYVDLRGMGANQGTVPITARYLEAVIRLSEASAKARLSRTVDIEDANRAIKLLEFCLHEIGIDRETGRMDIDILATGMSKSKADNTKNVYRIIKRLAGQHDDVTHEMILDAAKSEGVKPDDLDEILQTLTRNGDIYKPRHGHYRPSDKQAR